MSINFRQGFFPVAESDYPLDYPFEIVDTGNSAPANVSGYLTIPAIPLPALSKAYWLAKSVDWSITCSYDLTNTNGDYGNGTTTINGTLQLTGVPPAGRVIRNVSDAPIDFQQQIEVSGVWGNIGAPTEIPPNTPFGPFPLDDVIQFEFYWFADTPVTTGYFPYYSYLMTQDTPGNYITWAETFSAMTAGVNTAVVEFGLMSGLPGSSVSSSSSFKLTIDESTVVTMPVYIAPRTGVTVNSFVFDVSLNINNFWTGV
jgi:hypothetical protein